MGGDKGALRLISLSNSPVCKTCENSPNASEKKEKRSTSRHKKHTSKKQHQSDQLNETVRNQPDETVRNQLNETARLETPQKALHSPSTLVWSTSPASQGPVFVMEESGFDAQFDEAKVGSSVESKEVNNYSEVRVQPVEVFSSGDMQVFEMSFEDEQTFESAPAPVVQVSP